MGDGATYARTPWGYSVALPASGEMPPLITADRLYELTGGRFGPCTEGVDAALAGVSAAIRDACGWHVSPVMDCEERTQGPGRAIALRSLLVESVQSVTECGVELGEGQWQWRPDGMLRRACWRSWPDSWQSVVVRYSSGIPAEMAPTLATVAAQVASNCLAAPAGVRQEQAGDVSITYNQTTSGVSGGVRLLDSDLAMLRPYMLGEVLS